jgi:hypothetical protein
MQRLRERAGPTCPVEARAIELLRAAEPFQAPPGCKSRVRARLLEQRLTRPVGVLGAAPVFALVLLVAGASAAFGRQWIMASYRAFTERAVRSVSPAPSVAPESRMRVKTSGPQNEVAKAASSGASALPVPASAPASSVPQARGEVSRPKTRASEPDWLVFDAMRALRREGQPERASMLLDDYLRRHPGGALAEEALALSIEAATMRGDPRARALADRYLARYPTGRFRRVAEHARARTAP